jgi:hypothetical protein
MVELFHRLLKRLPRWERFKSFFQMAILQYLAVWFTVVPLVATLFEGIPRPLPLEWHGRTAALELALPFSWEVLWLSSFFFFIGLVLYHLRCPAFVKRYNQFSDYLASTHDPRWLCHEARAVVHDKALVSTFSERLLTRKYAHLLPAAAKWNETQNPTIEEKQTKLRFHRGNDKLVLAMPVLDAAGHVDPEAERGVFWEIFGLFSGSRPASRALVLVLLLASLFCFIFVLLQHVAYGLTQTFAFFDFDSAAKYLQQLTGWLRIK